MLGARATPWKVRASSAWRLHPATARAAAQIAASAARPAPRSERTSRPMSAGYAQAGRDPVDREADRVAQRRVALGLRAVGAQQAQLQERHRVGGRVAVL